MIARRYTRREFWSLLLSSAAVFGIGPARGADTPIYDQGIGGTGAAPPEPEESGDRGIGGTGVVGTIRKFGSIYVNDLRISYPETVTVRVDGAPATVRDLRIGQVVQAVALQSGDGYSTRRIDVTSEVVGPVEAVGNKTLTVLGQTVSLSDLGDPRPWRVGDFVAVSGLRRPDATIVASLISSRPPGPSRVAGLVQRGSDGALRVGGLRVRGVDPALVGQRALLVGRAANGGLAVQSQVNERSVLARGDVRRFLIEAYVARRNGSLELGSGLRVLGGGAQAPQSGVVRAIVRTNLGAGGRFTVVGLRQVLRNGETRPLGRGFPGGGRPIRNQGRLQRQRSLRRGFGNIPRRGGPGGSGPRGRGPWGGGPRGGGGPFGGGGGFGGPRGFGGGGLGGGPGGFGRRR